MTKQDLIEKYERKVVLIKKLMDKHGYLFHVDVKYKPQLKFISQFIADLKNME